MGQAERSKVTRFCLTSGPGGLRWFVFSNAGGGDLKLATLENGKPDGALHVVSRDLRWAVPAQEIAHSLLCALESWDDVVGDLESLYRRLNEVEGRPGKVAGVIPLVPSLWAAPLPRAPQWLDASAFPTHGERMVRAYGLDPKTLGLPYPLMYQGCSDNFLGPTAEMPVSDEAYGIDCEGEIAVITARVPMGTDAQEASKYIRLLTLVDDVSLRALLFQEMSMGFGMIHCKPTSVFGPVCVTPDELGPNGSLGKLNLTLTVHINEELLGKLHSDEMEFTFGQLVAHAAKTRTLAPGTIVGSGTFSNADSSRGCACVSERRAMETMATGSPSQQWLKFGDRVKMEAHDAAGQSIFGVIDHTFTKG